MAVHIDGWIEVKEGESWWGKIPVRNIGGRIIFASLFGVGRFGNLKPIAEGRGIPADASIHVEEQLRLYDGITFDLPYSHTYITYQEIKWIDWEEESIDDEMIHEYRDGKLVTTFSWSPDLSEQEHKDLSAGKTIKKGDREYRMEKEKVKRGDALDMQWEVWFALMDTLARFYGEENVRMVVWFSN